jgi:hypothetical protein
VAPFLESLGKADHIPIVTAAIAYDDPIRALTYITIVRQVLYFGDRLQHNLINPFQCRLNEVKTDECARVLSHKPTDVAHSIVFEQEQVQILLRLNGIISFFHSWRPSQQEFDTCQHLELMPEEPEWNPSDPTFGTRENLMIGDDGKTLR